MQHPRSGNQANQDRETFGQVPQDRATVKFGQPGGDANGGVLSALDHALKKDLYSAINEFVQECGPDFPGASQS